MKIENEAIRIRIAEMAAEVERLTTENARLQSEIDAANAQEPVAEVYRNSATGTGVEMHMLVGAPEGITKLYARPIPAQQSPSARDDQGFAIIEQALKRVSSGSLAEAPFPLTGDEARFWLNGAASAYQHALEMIVPQTLGLDFS